MGLDTGSLWSYIGVPGIKVSDWEPEEPPSRDVAISRWLAMLKLTLERSDAAPLDVRLVHFMGHKRKTPFPSTVWSFHRATRALLLPHFHRVRSLWITLTADSWGFFVDLVHGGPAFSGGVVRMPALHDLAMVFPWGAHQHMGPHSSRDGYLDAPQLRRARVRAAFVPLWISATASPISRLILEENVPWKADVSHLATSVLHCAITLVRLTLDARWTWTTGKLPQASTPVRLPHLRFLRFSCHRDQHDDIGMRAVLGTLDMPVLDHVELVDEHASSHADLDADDNLQALQQLPQSLRRIVFAWSSHGSVVGLVLDERHAQALLSRFPELHQMEVTAYTEITSEFIEALGGQRLGTNAQKEAARLLVLNGARQRNTETRAIEKIYSTDEHVIFTW